MSYCRSFLVILRRRERKLPCRFRATSGLVWQAIARPGKEDHVPNAVAELQSARFELGKRAVFRARRKPGGAVHQQRLLRKDLQDLNRIVFPVRGYVKIAPRS